MTERERLYDNACDIAGIIKSISEEMNVPIEAAAFAVIAAQIIQQCDLKNIADNNGISAS